MSRLQSGSEGNNNAAFNTRFVQTFPILHWLVPKLEKFKAAICWKQQQTNNSKCASGGFHMWADQLMWLGRKWAYLIRTSVIRILWKIKPPFFSWVSCINVKFAKYMHEPLLGYLIRCCWECLLAHVAYICNMSKRSMHTRQDTWSDAL